MGSKKIFLLFIMLIGWFALIAQLVLHLQTVPTGLAESLLRFFSYFTILTNILVATYCTVLLFATRHAKTGFFFRASAQTAIALYIVVVGLIYNIILRQLWDSHGLQAVLHDLLHTIAPLMMLIYWWVWVDARSLKFNDMSAWLVYPAGYAVAVLLRGSYSNWYPYPFLDAGTYGYSKVLINSAGLLIVFLIFSILLVLIGKRKRLPHAATGT